MNLILDIGNTRIKLAVFQEDKLIELIVVLSDNLEKKILEKQKKYQLNKVIVSSVASIDPKALVILESFQQVIILDQSTKTPFFNRYKTPKTLGVDRIALVCAAVDQYSQKNVLVIDAGTCITFDFVNMSSEYLGGAISPGVQMRYKSLSAFTANLPELEISEFSLTGKNTEESIHSGVLNGILHEIDGVIAAYQDKYSDLTIVLTGGDANFLAKKLKSSIFAIPNFLLEGLNTILTHNKDE